MLEPHSSAVAAQTLESLADQQPPAMLRRKSVLAEVAVAVERLHPPKPRAERALRPLSFAHGPLPPVALILRSPPFQ